MCTPTKQRLGMFLAMTVLLVAVVGCASESDPARKPVRAGLRSSHYGISPFPDANWWLDSTGSMAAHFADSAPAVIWIVGTVESSSCWLNFPAATPGGEYPHIILSNYWDSNEEYLKQFDQAGIQVWLQVEPAGADIPTLIDLVLEKYAAHPSVVGFGVDVEWYQNTAYHEGKAVTDAEAQAWSEQVRSYNPEYQLFLKHWLPEKLPPMYREGVMFLDDSQGFDSFAALSREFKDWGQAFAPAPVGFQYGYQSDRKWWGDLSDPPKDIGQTLMETIPNTTDIYWVDFTAEELWPQP